MKRKPMNTWNSKLPNVGDYVTTDDGFKGEVSSVNVLRQLVKVIVTLENDEKEIMEQGLPVEVPSKTQKRAAEYQRCGAEGSGGT